MTKRSVAQRQTTDTIHHRPCSHIESDPDFGPAWGRLCLNMATHLVANKPFCSEHGR